MERQQLEDWVSEIRVVWPAMAMIERWLDTTFAPPWPDDVRRYRDRDGHTVMCVPDYAHGFTRSLTVHREALRDCPTDAILAALEAAHWGDGDAKVDLLVSKGQDGQPEIADWNAPRFEKWHQLETGEWVVAYQAQSGGIAVHATPRPIEHFVALRTRTRSSMGPMGICDISTLDPRTIESHWNRQGA